MVFVLEHWRNSHIAAKNGKVVDSGGNDLREDNEFWELGREVEAAVVFVGAEDTKVE